MYDSRLIAYTRRTPLDKQGGFMFSGLAPGRYIVWISSDLSLGVLTFGPPIAFSADASQARTADLAGRYVKSVYVDYGTALISF